MRYGLTVDAIGKFVAMRGKSMLLVEKRTLVGRKGHCRQFVKKHRSDLNTKVKSGGFLGRKRPFME